MLWNNKYKPKSEKELREKWQQLPLEKGDIKALIFAALITLLPAVLLVGCIFALAIWVMFLQ